MQTVLSPQLQEATQSLIDNLLASAPFLAYKQARIGFHEDPEARTLLERLTRSQARLRQKQDSGGVTQAEIDALRNLQERVQRDSIIMTYGQSQQEAVNFLREINNEISQLLGINFASLANHATC
jgi:cell fate (sporulation/competence/biofilm development) regulator YlbF (YheA/YmcA/DUF963 family)